MVFIYKEIIIEKFALIQVLFRALGVTEQLVLPVPSTDFILSHP